MYNVSMKIAFCLLFIIVSCNQSHKSKAVPYMEPLDGRPTALIVGDSIARGYRDTVKASFPEYQVIKNRGNAQNTAWGRANIEAWSAWSPHWEFCTINHGLHDLIFRPVAIDDYEANLRIEIEVLKARCDRVIFVTTTRIPDGFDQATKDRHADYRAVSLDVANDLNVPVCDLFLVSETIANLHIPSIDNTNVHYVPEGYRQLGLAVSECVNTL
jgi:hypothetical protein